MHPFMLCSSTQLRRGGNPEALLHAQALKESFIKAIGTGLGFNLQRAEFHLSPHPVTEEQGQHRTMMHLDEEEEDSWRFEVCSEGWRGDGGVL